MICVNYTMLYKLYTVCVKFYTYCVNLCCFVANFPLFQFTRFCVKFCPQKLWSGKSFDKYHVCPQRQCCRCFSKPFIFSSLAIPRCEEEEEKTFVKVCQQISIFILKQRTVTNAMMKHCWKITNHYQSRVSSKQRFAK